MLNLTSCFLDCERGEGKVGSISKEIEGFESIDLRGSGKIIITKARDFSFTIETNENLFPFLEQEVIDGNLEISTNKCITSYTKLIYYIGMPELTGINLSGSGDIKCEDSFDADQVEINISGSGDIQGEFDAEEINISISGSGNISMSGKSERQKINITGSGDYYGYKLKSDRCEVSIVGSGEAEVYVTDNLDASVMGSGDIYYKGSPDVTTSVTGSGSIIRK